MRYFRGLLVRRKMREVLEKISALEPKPRKGMDYLKKQAAEFAKGCPEAAEAKVRQHLGDNPFLVVYYQSQDVVTIGEVFIAHLVCKGKWWYLSCDGNDSNVSCRLFSQLIDHLAEELTDLIVNGTWTSEIMTQHLRVVIWSQVVNPQKTIEF